MRIVKTVFLVLGLALIVWSVHHIGLGPILSTLERLTYAYDLLGNRTADTRNREAHQYGYDRLDQLIQVQVPRTASRWRTGRAPRRWRSSR